MREKNGRLLRSLNVENILEMLYLLAFVLLVAYMFLETTMWEVHWPGKYMDGLLCILASLILGRVCFSKNYSVKETVFAVILTVVLLYAWKQNGYVELYYLLLMILGAKDISEKKLMKVYFGITIVLFAIVIVLALTGKIENLVYYQEGHRTRMALGIYYPTDFSAHVFFCSLVYVFIREEKLRWFEVMGILLVGTGAFWITDARMNFLCTLLFCAGLFLYLFYRKYCRKKGKPVSIPAWMSYIAALMPVLCAGSMILLTVLYTRSSHWLGVFNRLINARLSFGKAGIDQYGFSNWGQYVEMIGGGKSVETKTNYFFIDCSYVSGLLRWGNIAFAVILFVMLIICYKARKENRWVFLWVMVLISIQCSIEHRLIEIAYSPFLWLLFAKEAEKDDTKVFKRAGGAR